MEYASYNVDIMPLSVQTSDNQIKNILDSLKWGNNKDRGYYFQSSIDKFRDIYEKYGQYNNIINDIGGFAQWYKKDFYEKIEVYDRVLINTWPYKHNSIITIYVHLVIRRDYWLKIETISSNLLYDFLTNTLIIRCPTLSYGNSLLAIILEYLNGDITWANISNTPLVINRLTKKRLTDETFQEKDIQTIKKYIT